MCRGIWVPFIFNQVENLFFHKQRFGCLQNLSHRFYIVYYTCRNWGERGGGKTELLFRFSGKLQIDSKALVSIFSLSQDSACVKWEWKGLYTWRAVALFICWLFSLGICCSNKCKSPSLKKEEDSANGHKNHQKSPAHFLFFFPYKGLTLI